jgi:hypothetical protein
VPPAAQKKPEDLGRGRTCPRCGGTYLGDACPRCGPGYHPNNDQGRAKGSGKGRKGGKPGPNDWEGWF